MEERTVDTTASVNLKEVDTHKGAYGFAHYKPSEGSMALLLPYRKKVGSAHFLLRRELIPCWDTHTDICGIAIYGAAESVEGQLVEALKNEAGYTVKASELKSLGVCACDRITDTVCYLYTVDLSRHDAVEEKLTVDENITFWGSAEEVLESLDSQLITCLAKLRYLLL